LLPQNSAEAKDTRQKLAELARVSHDTVERVEYILIHADKDTINALRWDAKGISINKVFTDLKVAIDVKKPAKPKKTASSTKAEVTPSAQPQEATVLDTKPTPEPSKPVVPTFPGETLGFAPGSEEEEKYSPKTQLKPIPRNRPDVLVRNLMAHFPKEFVPNMIRSTFQILVDVGEKKQAKELATEIYKTFGRK